MDLRIPIPHRGTGIRCPTSLRGSVRVDTCSFLVAVQTKNVRVVKLPASLLDLVVVKGVRTGNRATILNTRLAKHDFKPRGFAEIMAFQQHADIA